MSSCVAPTFNPVDVPRILERFEGDEELVREIAQLVIQEYPPLVDALRDAAAQGDAYALERNAHSLKGMVANFQADSAVDAALTLERMGRVGDLTGAHDCLRRLESALADLHHGLTAAGLLA
jgi:two-component system, sensor histidine kinase and response regulator